MKKSITPFCDMIHKPNDISVKKISNAIKKAESTNLKLFKIKPKKYYIELVYSNKEYDNKCNFKITTRREGATNKNKIILISPEIKKPTYDYKSFFAHEINHIFYISLVGDYQPIWFSEGMATFVMKSYKINKTQWKEYFRKIKKPEKFLYYRYIQREYHKNANIFFPLVYLVYSYLNKKFGHDAINSFLKDFSKNPSKKRFTELFLKHFKQTQKQAVHNSIK